MNLLVLRPPELISRAITFIVRVRFTKLFAFPCPHLAELTKWQSLLLPSFLLICQPRNRLSFDALNDSFLQTPRFLESILILLDERNFPDDWTSRLLLRALFNF